MKKAKKLGFDTIIVLGHNEYYPKFGFIEIVGKVPVKGLN